MKYKNIYKVKGRYNIRKTIYNRVISYGTFADLETAIEQRDLLIRHNWHKNYMTRYPKKLRFPKYQIKTSLCGYLVINRKTGKTFGTYKNYRYAQLIKKILPYYENKIDIENIERVAHKEFYKHIYYNNLNGRYYIVYKGIVRYTNKNLKTMLYERDLIVKYDGDEELMCEDPTIVHDYEKEELPSFEYEYETIRYNDKTQMYQLEKQIRNHKLVIGNYQTYNLACLIKRYLDKKQWNKKEVKRIIDVTRIIHKRDHHITKRGKQFFIERKVKDEIKIYGVYSDIEMARYVKDNLVLNNWHGKYVKHIEKKYYKTGYESQYYYDSTDFFGTTVTEK